MSLSLFVAKRQLIFLNAFFLKNGSIINYTSATLKFPFYSSNRLLSATSTSFKKADKYTLLKEQRQIKRRGKIEGDEEILFKQKEFLEKIEDQYESTLKLSLNECKKVMAGKSQESIFNDLVVNYAKDQPSVKFTSLAHSNLKGKKIIITVYDPSHTKHIISTILASGLNLTPVQHPNNPQLLTVDLPEVTADDKKKKREQIKATINNFLTSRDPKSCTSIRADALKELRDFTGKQQDIFVEIKGHVEKINTIYTNELREMPKEFYKKLL